ncbi:MULTISPECIES: DsbA family protein [Streptomyces]|uniref:Disulfide bond formation protein DsbA n=1 Tax=Streptomyces venezuelae TaxID=54571 RepID=A0A5P2BE90_STRVZ|nr:MULTISPECIES: DsbA family protein [Streptomyces]NEA06510.1 DsbA family protein [Streptomyces sp. SID10116]MYY83013.1 thioredoxin domain-containing protein [Streptomyces sp. SID335]MYZ15029.1 thioredoxin domain-containing protein [Streptomyces sp. SID337]NDZ85514.1 DsbA family protein [Streptomyces sp. SID10115]NEB50167.1 DsbA family protein [Streptomyces sp. SID339]
MSKRNSQAAKSAARERIRAQQEAERRREKRKRGAIVAGAIVGVLAIAGGVGYAVMQSNAPSKWEEAADAKVVAPANTSGEDGTTVTIGKSDTKNTVHLYEDPRCPGCAAMEQSIGSAVDKGMKDGDYKLSFTIGTFLDNNLSGEGSKNALSALGAALDVSTDAFLEYKTALYSAKYHPSESTDDFAKDEYLIKVANTVDALKGNKKFKSAVEKGKFDPWALKMSDAFQSAEGVESTPTIKINDKVVETPKTPDAWKATLKKAGVTK